MCSLGLIREIKNRKHTQSADINASIIFIYSLIQCPGACPFRKLSIIGDLPASVIQHLANYPFLTDEKVIDKN